MTDPETQQHIALLRRVIRQLERGELVVDECDVTAEPVATGATDRYGLPRHASWISAVTLRLGAPGAPQAAEQHGKD
jgi:hypothetical protein